MQRFSFAAAACRLFLALGALGVSSLCATAAPPTIAVSAGGYYVWVDGMYDHVPLPKYSLGLHTDSNAGSPTIDYGAAQAFDPRLDGGGVRGAIGYMFPGSTVRIEIGGSYIGANGSTVQDSTYTTYLALPLQFLNGTLAPSAWACKASGPLIPCFINGNLGTDYTAWQFNGKVAADYNYGSVTLTPSGAIFGGISTAEQSLVQSFERIIYPFVPPGPLVVQTGSYSAVTRLRWTDIGARAGLDISAPLTPALTVALGGWVGLAERWTSLQGSDSGASSDGFYNAASTLSISDSKGVFLANAEARFVYRFNPMLALRGFAGLNYDGSVPGIASPTYGGYYFGPISPTTASIHYAHETSYYAGGGVSVTW